MRKRLLNLCLTALFSVVCTAAWALDGVYQISSAADWEEFAALVNDGDVTANAELTADIDLGANFTMVGTNDNSQAYHGTFDGKGHTIKINMYPEENYAAIFRYVGWRAVIQNLKVEGTIHTSYKFAAGIAGRCRGTIRNCWAAITIDSSVPGDATHGGIAGTCTNGTIIENCLAQVAIVGETTQNCGGVIGWADSNPNIVNCLVVSDGSAFDLSSNASRNICRNDGKVVTVNVETYNQDSYNNRPAPSCYNNYVTNDWGGSNPSVEVVPFDELADGRICYQLNNDQSRIAWVQTIGTDPFPVPAPFGDVQTGRVYASRMTECDGKSMDAATYSNSGTDMAEKHQFDKYGICTTCGLYNFHAFEFDDPTRFDPVSRSILLGSKEDIDLAEGYNRIVNGFKLHLKMVNDIEYIAEPGHYIFNTNDWSEGNFDGGGHELTIEMTEMGNNAALFPQRHYGTVENLIMHGKIETSGMYWGSISNDSYESAVRNVFSDIDFVSTHVGDNTAGGFFGMIRTGKTVENCIYAGTMTLPGEGSSCARIGGFAGWTHAATYFKNCAVMGNIIGAGDQCDQGETENSGNIARNYGNVNCENVYVVNPITGRDITDSDKYIVYDNSNDGIAAGEFAFFLNGKQSGVERFFQRIGTDQEPLPIPREGGLIYAKAVSYTCDGTPIGAIYQNTPAGDPVLPPHEYDELGFCVNCGAIQEDFMTPVDGWYEIGTPEQFLWWSNYASTHLDASAKLTADIDLEDYNEIDETTGRPITPKFAQVGSEYKPFYGNFDGQRHTISNLNINLLGKRGCGLISVMNSQPEAGYGGVDGDAARAEEGVYVKDVVLDETCSITGGGYTGIVGMGSPWAGHITITGCMNLGDVYVVAGTNGAGIYGCSMGSACRVTISFCGMIGDIHVENDTRAENGSFSGWLGDYAEVSNCFALGTVDYIDTARGFARHPNSSQVYVTNCYALAGAGIVQNNHDGSKEDVTYVTMDALTTGEVTWGANGKQFRNPVWYQTLGEDDYPYPFDTHGVVIFGYTENNAGVEEDVYFSIPDDDLATVASSIQEHEKEVVGEVLATQALLDDYAALLEALTDAETLEAFADALDAVNAKKPEIAANAKVYEAYIAKCEEIKAHLAGHDDFAGELRDALEYYLSEENIDGPSNDNPLGTYEYIIEKHTATAEEIEAETKRVAEWLQMAIAGGYIAGTDVSNLILNSDFSQKNEGWTNGWANDWVELEGTQTQNGKVIGVEAWNVTGDMFQTVEGMKPGYYLVGTHGAFRPSNNRYSTNYAAGIYANGIFNYFPAVIEDPVSVDDAEDGVNCNLTIKSAYDLAIFDDGESTSDEAGATLTGYVVHGPYGMALAANVGRYEAYTIAKVGEDGKLTIGFKNPGTHYSNDWTGWTALKVVYCGEENEKAGESLDLVLENMAARANTIIQYEYDQYYSVKGAASGPNFPEALRSELQETIDAVATAETVEAKAELVAKFSELFESVYEAKQAYIQLADASNLFMDLTGVANLSLIEKDEETGDWYDTGEMLFNDEETTAFEDISFAMSDAFEYGTYSTKEAQDAVATALANPAIPSQDEEGYYLVGTPKQMAVYRYIASENDAKAKAKLTADIDMTGIAMLPFGHNRSGENAVHIYRGVLDGQGFTLGNVYISEDYTQGDPATLFYELKNATVKNLKLTGEYFNTNGAKFMGGLTRWTSESSTIDNCEIAVVMHSFIQGDGTHGGVVGISGDGTTISNCLVNVTMIGESENPTTNCGGVSGWANSAPTINNTLIISQYQNIAKGDNSNVIGRNGYTANNVFYIERSNPGFDTGGTLATEEQLTSGELTWKLNGSTADDAHWFQTLGVDEMPRLFDGATVYYYGGKFINEQPNPQLNAFAYNLDAKQKGSNVVVSFNLNAEAEAAEIIFSNDYSVSVPAEELTVGEHSVVVPVERLGANDPTALNYSIKVTGKGSEDVLRMGDVYKVWGPYGMAVNNNPESKNFGQVLIAESYPMESKDPKYISCNKNGAIFAFDQNFKPINSADGTPGFYGEVPVSGTSVEEPLIIAGSYKYDFKDIRFTEDGRLFVARANGKTNSSVWEINPEDLDEPWTPVFTGGELDEATGITYVGNEEQNRMALSLAFDGKGEDLKMYVLGGQRSNGGNNTTDYNCSIYNLGTATEWTGAPSANFEPLDGVYTYSPYYVGIHEDGQGGLWYIQHVSSPSAEYPVLKHFDAEGNEDYSRTSQSLNGARIAVTPDGEYLAMPNGSGSIALYQIDYVPLAETGRIQLTPKHILSVGETSITCMAFDWANNLYVASAGSETLSRYTVPGMNKVVVTPGNGIVNGLEGDLNKDGKVDIADAVTVLNIMASGEYDAEADLNGDQKIDIADFVTVLNIMAAQ